MRPVLHWLPPSRYYTKWDAWIKYMYPMRFAKGVCATVFKVLKYTKQNSRYIKKGQNTLSKKVLY